MFSTLKSGGFVIWMQYDMMVSLYFSFQNVKAQRAMMEMRGFSLKGSRLQTDYASHECRARFFELCKKYGIDIKERSRPWEEDNSQDSSYRYVNPQFTLDLSFHSLQFVMECTLRFQMEQTSVQKVTLVSKCLKWIGIVICHVINDMGPLKCTSLLKKITIWMPFKAFWEPCNFFYSRVFHLEPKSELYEQPKVLTKQNILTAMSSYLNT